MVFAPAAILLQPYARRWHTAVQQGLRAIFALVVALAVAWAVASLWWPYGADQAWIGWVADVIRHGGRPYVDAWDNNAPGEALQQVVIQALFGTAQWPVRALDLVYLSLTCWALVVLGRRLHSPWAGYWACAIFVCAYAAAGHWHTAQRDGHGAMLVTWALALAGTGGLGPMALAGLLVGFATLIKPQLALMLLPVLVLLHEQRDANPARPCRLRALMLLGFFLVPLVAVAAWLAAGRGLRQAFECMVLYNTRVYLHQPSPDVTHGLLYSFVKRILELLPLTALAAAGAAYLHAGRQAGRWSVGTAWPAAACAAILIGGKLFRYHWHVLQAPMSLLGGIGIGALADLRRSDQPQARPVLTTVLLALVVGVFADPCRFMAVTVRWWVVRMRTHEETPASLGPYGVPRSNLQAFVPVADYIKARTSPGEPIQVWSWQPAIYFLAERPCATRFGYHWPLVHTAGPLPELHRTYVDEFLRGLETTRPRYFVVDTDEIPALRQVSQIEAYLRRNYSREAQMGDFAIFVRRSPSDSRSVSRASGE